MPDWSAIERTLFETVGSRRRPVAVAFRDAPPPGVSRFAGREPSGCSFWRLAADGRAFYTVPGDHANCAIGSYTHNIPLPAERAAELEQTLGVMTGLGYVRMQEVPGIPRLPATPGAVVYAPLGATPVEPDVIAGGGTGGIRDGEAKDSDGGDSGGAVSRQRAERGVSDGACSAEAGESDHDRAAAGRA